MSSTMKGRFINVYFISGIILLLIINIFMFTACSKKDKESTEVEDEVTTEDDSSSDDYDNDYDGVFSDYDIVKLNVRGYKTSSLIGTPADGKYAEFNSEGKDGGFEKGNISVYASSKKSSGSVPGAVYIWTGALEKLEEEKSGKGLNLFRIRSGKKKKGNIKDYIYLSGDILLDSSRGIIIIAMQNDRISAIEYFHPDKTDDERSDAVERFSAIVTKNVVK